MKIANKLKVALKRMLSLELGQVETDKAVLFYDGELAEGIEVFVEDENGELVPAGDGEYVVEDRTIVVEGGVVKELRDKEEEEPAEEVVEEVEADEISEPAADPVEDPAEEEVKSDEERIAAVEALVAGMVEGIERLVNAIAALEDRISAIENKIADLEKEPAAEPVVEQEIEETVPKTRISYLRKN